MEKPINKHVHNYLHERHRNIITYFSLVSLLETHKLMILLARPIIVSKSWMKASRFVLFSVI